MLLRFVLNSGVDGGAEEEDAADGPDNDEKIKVLHKAVYNPLTYHSPLYLVAM